MLYLWILQIVKHPILIRLLFNLLDKINLKKSDEYVALFNLTKYGKI